MMEKVQASFQNLVDLTVEYAPKVLLGLLLVIAALLVAKVIEKLLRALLVRVKLDNLVEKAGIDKTLQRVGIRQQLNQFLPRLVYFLILLLLAKTAADALGLVAISQAFTAFFSYLPNLIAALLLIVIGSAAAAFIGDAVKNSAGAAGLDFAPALGRLVAAVIMFIVGIMAITQLKIDTEIIRLVTSFVLAGAALAFGLTIGLGTRDVTRNIFAGFYAKKVLNIGSKLSIKGEQGVLRGITATHAIIETDGERITLSNSAFLEEIAKSSKD